MSGCTHSGKIYMTRFSCTFLANITLQTESLSRLQRKADQFHNAHTVAISESLGPLMSNATVVKGTERMPKRQDTLRAALEHKTRLTRKVRKIAQSLGVALANY